MCEDESWDFERGKMAKSGLDWGNYRRKIFTEEATKFFEEEFEDKDYAISPDDVDKFCYSFEKGKYPLPLIPECHVLSLHSTGILWTEEYFKFYYYILKNWEWEREWFSERSMLEAALFAETFFLGWYSYFEKLSHIMNASIGCPFDTERGRGKVKECTFKGICNYIINDDQEKYNRLLLDLADIKGSPIYKKIEKIRHDLTHRYMTLFTLAGSNIYGAVVERRSRTTKFTLGAAPEYDLDEINSIIDEATDLLVEIKEKVLDYADETGYSEEESE